MPAVLTWSLRTRRSFRLVLASGCVAALIGCGGGGPSVAPTAQPSLPTMTAAPPSATPEPAMTLAVLDACAILPKKDAEEIARTPLETGAPGNPLEPSCMYPGPVTGPLAQVEIYIGDGAKKAYDIDVGLNHEFVDVPGIGDEAFLEDNNIFFRKAATWVSIRLVRLNDPVENREALIEAAKTVAERLP